MNKHYKKPKLEYITLNYSEIVCASPYDGPESAPEMTWPVKSLLKSKNYDPDADYYLKDGTYYSEDELSDFLNDETPF